MLANSNIVVSQQIIKIEEEYKVSINYKTDKEGTPS